MRVMKPLSMLALLASSYPCYGAKVLKVIKDKDRVVIQLDKKEAAGVAKGQDLHLKTADGKEVEGKVRSLNGNNALVDVEFGLETLKAGTKLSLKNTATGEDKVSAAETTADKKNHTDTEEAATTAGTSSGSGLPTTSSSMSFVKNQVEINTHATDMERWDAARMFRGSFAYTQGNRKETSTTLGVDATTKTKLNGLNFGVIGFMKVSPAITLGASFVKNEQSFKVSSDAGSDKSKLEDQRLALHGSYRVQPNLALGLDLTNHDIKLKPDGGASDSTSHSTVSPSLLYVTGQLELTFAWLAPYSIKGYAADPGYLSVRSIYGASDSLHLIGELRRRFYSALDGDDNSDSFDLLLGARLLNGPLSYAGYLYYQPTYNSGSDKLSVFNDDILGIKANLQYEMKPMQALEVLLDYEIKDGKKNGVKWSQNMMTAQFAYHQSF